MSVQNSIYFDPTALLILKKEIDSTLRNVESTVSDLIEEKTAPFGIDDALAQLEQTIKVFEFIELPQLAVLSQYCAEVMHKFIEQPANIRNRDISAFSDGITMLKRYVEFICLREVHVPQFLIDSLNQLEIALGKPLTQAGESLIGNNLVQNIGADTILNDAQFEPIDSSDFALSLFKSSLNRLFNQTETAQDFDALKFVGLYLAQVGQNTQYQQYWQLVHTTFNQLDEIVLSDARLRILAKIQTQASELISSPDKLTIEPIDQANLLSLAISQENSSSQQLRQHFQVNENILTDTQLHIFSRHLFGPDQNTIEAVSELLTLQLNQVRQEIEQLYTDISDEKIQLVRNQLFNLAQSFLIMNLNEAHAELTYQANHLNKKNILENPDFAQRMMNCILSAINSIGILKRNFAPTKLQYNLNNMNISLDQLDEAHKILMEESQILINDSSELLIKLLTHHDQVDLKLLSENFRQLSGAAYFLNAESVYQALLNSSDLILEKLDQQTLLSKQNIHDLLESLASLDLMIYYLKNKQPVVPQIFKLALAHSQKLKAVA